MSKFDFDDRPPVSPEEQELLVERFRELQPLFDTEITAHYGDIVPPEDVLEEASGGIPEEKPAKFDDELRVSSRACFRFGNASSVIVSVHEVLEGGSYLVEREVVRLRTSTRPSGSVVRAIDKYSMSTRTTSGLDSGESTEYGYSGKTQTYNPVTDRWSREKLRNEHVSVDQDGEIQLDFTFGHDNFLNLMGTLDRAFDSDKISLEDALKQ